MQINVTFFILFSNICYIIYNKCWILAREIPRCKYFASVLSSTCYFRHAVYPNLQTTGDLIADASERSAKGSETSNRNLGFTSRSRCPIIVKLRNTHFTLSTTNEIHDGNRQYCRTGRAREPRDERPCRTCARRSTRRKMFKPQE